MRTISLSFQSVPLPRRSVGRLLGTLLIVVTIGVATPTSSGQVTLRMPPPPVLPEQAAPQDAAGDDLPTVGDVALYRFAGARSGPRRGPAFRGPYERTRWWSGYGYGGYGYRVWGWPYGGYVTCGPVFRHHPHHALSVPTPGTFRHVRGYPRTPRIRHANQFSP